MKFYTSYFYQIRFFEPYMIPISTAMFDPKWYHQNRGNDFVYKDKRGVYNGIRYADLSPHSVQCDCPCLTKTPPHCSFLICYQNYLNSLNFTDIINNFSSLGAKIQNIEHYNHDIEFVLIVHETPDNPCSERYALQKWLRQNGIDCQEWQKNLIFK